MNTITIPQSLIKEKDLVLVPRREYEELLKSASGNSIISELDQDLDEAMAQYRAGNSFGPFDAKGSIKFLNSLKSKKGK